MLENLSDDVLWRVFRYLDVKSRTRLSAVNATFYKLFNKWKDVLYCSIRGHDIALSGKDFVLEVQNRYSANQCLMIEPLLKRCPLIRKLAIHDERVLCPLSANVMHSLVNVYELYICSNFFAESKYDSLIQALFSFSKLHLLHVQQRYNEDKCHRNILREGQVEQLASTSLNDIKLQGIVITGPVLKLLCLKYQKTLEKLCLLGALVPSEDAFTCFQAINDLDRLTWLTLAPSLYSISSTNHAFFKSYPSLKKCKTLKSVAAYMSKPDVAQLKIMFQQILPVDIEQLILYDESDRSMRLIEQESKEFKRKIRFGREDNIIMDSYWMNGKSELVAHTMWKPPYKTNSFLPASLPEWYCVISEFMETAVITARSSGSSSSYSTIPDLSEISECSCGNYSTSDSVGNETCSCSCLQYQDETPEDMSG